MRTQTPLMTEPAYKLLTAGLEGFAVSLDVFMRAYVRTREMPIGYLPLVATTAGVDAIGFSSSARITIAVAGLHVCSLHGCIVCERYVAHCLSVAASM